MSEHRDEGYIDKVQTSPIGQVGSRLPCLTVGKWITVKLDAMNTKGTAKEKKTGFTHRMEKLYRFIRMWLHVLFLRIFMVIILVRKVIKLEGSPCRIALARKRIVNRFYYPLRFATFPIRPVLRLLGNRPTAK